MANVAKDFAQLISQSKSNKTGPYDTQATVKRVEGNTVWVSIPGGVDETPIDKTVNCSAGDKVQVRVSGGRAWITGNASAPPTDDKTANEAKTKAVVAEATAIDAKETADTVDGKASSALTQATQALSIARNSNQYFWHTETGTDTGAHITEVPQDEFTDSTSPNYQSGGNLLARSNGIAVRDGMTELATFGASGQTFNNDYSRAVFTVGKTPTQTFGGKYNSFVYDGTSPFEFTLPWDVNSIFNLKYYDANGALLNISYFDGWTLNDRTVTIDAAKCAELISNNVALIKVQYSATGAFPYFTFGDPGAESMGIMSIRAGDNCEASGYLTFAGGEGAIASGAESFAFGEQTVASGIVSTAFGEKTVASGTHSYAQNEGTIADQINQTAIGAYNTANNTYNIFVIGNGASDNSRADAFTVDMFGNVEAAGDITDGSGNVLSDKIESSYLAVTGTTIYSSQSISGSGYVSATSHSLTPPDNAHTWKALSVAGWYLNQHNVRFSTCYIDGNASVFCGLHNDSTGTLSVNLTIYVLWIRTA